MRNCRASDSYCKLQAIGLLLEGIDFSRGAGAGSWQCEPDR